MSIIYQVPHLPMLGKGSVLLDIFDANGLPTGFQHLGNATKFEIELKDEVAELFQSLNKSVTQIASAIKKRQGKVTITGTDFSSGHMAIVNMAAGKTSLAVTAGTITAETLASATAVKLGRYFYTATPNIDNVGTLPILHGGAAGTTLLVAGTDYVVADAQKGLIYFPLTSTVDPAHAVLITYNTLVGAFDEVAPATVPFQQGHLLFVPDPVDGQKIQVDIWKVNLHPQGQIGLIADDYGNWSLDGEILDNTANTPLSPFYKLRFF